MSFDEIVLLAILLFTMAAFVFEWMAIDVVALTGLALLMLFGLVSLEEAISGFSNEAVITVMMMFILSDALVRTGLIGKLAHRLAEISGPSHWRGSLALMVIAGALSAFINNVAALTIFMPVCIHLAKHYRISPSRLLLPLSYATIFGGACTLVGTSSNLLISSLVHEHDLPPFTMFELSGIGIVLFVVGMIYNFLVPMRFLPERAETSSLTGKYHLDSFLTEVRVPEGSRLLDRTVMDEQVNERFRITVLQVIREKRKISTDLRHLRFKVGDTLIIRGAMEDILAFQSQTRVQLLTEVKLRDMDLSDDRNILAEVQLAPVSDLIGLTLEGINFRKRFGCFVLALNRTGEMIQDKIATIPLQSWDTVLVYGPRTRVEALADAGQFLPIVERELRLHLPRRWWIAALTVPAVMLLAAFGVMPILEAAILGVVTLLVTRRLTTQQAYKAINWTVIFMVAAILPMGQALINTGLAHDLGKGIASLGASIGPLAVVALLFLATSVLSEIVSNTSTAVLMVPIAFSTAEMMNLDPKAFLMAVTFAAATSFLTPMGYKTNTMVYGPGGYQFNDFIKVGLPLKFIFWIITVFLIPFFYPLQ